MKVRAGLAILLLCLTGSVFGQFSKPAREAEDLAAQGVPISQQTMEMTADLIWRMTVDLTDDSGHRIGSGLLGTFYGMQDKSEKYGTTVSYVLAPQGVLGNASRVTVSCHAASHQNMAPLTVELRAEGKARNVFPGSGEAQGLNAVLLPQDFRECGYDLEELIESGDRPNLNAGMEVWFPRRETDAAKEGPAGSKSLEFTALQRPGPGGKDAWAVSAAHRDQAGGMPGFHRGPPTPLSFRGPPILASRLSHRIGRAHHAADGSRGWTEGQKPPRRARVDFATNHRGGCQGAASRVGAFGLGISPLSKKTG